MSSGNPGSRQNSISISNIIARDQVSLPCCLPYFSFTFNFHIVISLQLLQILCEQLHVAATVQPHNSFQSILVDHLLHGDLTLSVSFGVSLFVSVSLLISVPFLLTLSRNISIYLRCQLLAYKNLHEPVTVDSGWVRNANLRLSIKHCLATQSGSFCIKYTG